ncbi:MULTISPECIES: hypothetical protein [Sphingobacterium]|uniref:hypothetical protein n=2 Tax=Sphingobacteriaceae TaxID=84566 RepID=UPI00155330EF|nr:MULTISPECIES: hypothetical protein [Sphingobacterium]NPE44865.1 hypothetical protein [Sphingobacterium prati]
MMYRPLLFLLSFFLLSVVGCKKSEEDDTVSGMSILFSDNNHAVRGKVSYDYTMDNCGNINLITGVKESDGNYSELKLTLLHNGALAKAQYFKQNSSNNGHYFAPHLQAEKSFQISDFKYDKSGGHLSFSFKGKVYKGSGQDDERILTGNVDLTAIEYVPCKGLILDVMTENPSFNFFSMYSSAGTTTSGLGTANQYIQYAYNVHSNAGQYMSLRLDSDISELVNKEMVFDDSNEKLGVKYWEYQGPFMLAESYGYIDHNWKRFQTRGKITGIHRTFGERSVEPYYQGLIIMDILNESRVVKEDVEIPFYVKSLK